MPYIRSLRVANFRSLQGVNVDLTPGEDVPPFRHLILTGANGSGKTTLLHFLARVLDNHQAHGVDNIAAARQNIAQTLQALDHPALTSEMLKQQRASLANQESALAAQLDSMPVELTWSDELIAVRQAFMDRRHIAAYLPARRNYGDAAPQGPRSLGLGSRRIKATDQMAPSLHQYLVNRKAEQAFALLEGDKQTAERPREWLNRIGERIRRLLGIPDGETRFDPREFVFTFHGRDGTVFRFGQLADGHAAVLDILGEVLLRVAGAQEAVGDLTFEPSGVVIIDELETHLHLSLQEQLLPALTEWFPTLQFIVATHSAAVIPSIPNAVVANLATGQQVLSDQLRGRAYGDLMMAQFGLEADYDLATTEQLVELKQLSELSSPSDEQKARLAELALVLSDTGHTLALRVERLIRNGGLRPTPPDDDA